MKRKREKKDWKGEIKGGEEWRGKHGKWRKKGQKKRMNIVVIKLVSDSLHTEYQH